AGVLPPVDLNVELAVAGEGRSVRLLGRSAVGNGWLERLSQQPQLQAFFAASREE
ncbi:tRNA (adenosine(37)-N6)-threonylcarbamoyltransferase complex ATPase subunit type 1 TsaE, partial [Xanthomonas oryzae pv. oryzae]